MSVLIYPSLQQPVPTAEGNTTEDVARWYKQWADPDLGVKVRGQALAARIASGMAPMDAKWENPAEPITVDKWWRPFSERLHAKPGLKAWLQPYHTDLTPAAPFEETVYIDKYLYPFGLPVWHKARLVTGAQPYFATGAHALGTPYARAYVIC